MLRGQHRIDGLQQGLGDGHPADFVVTAHRLIGYGLLFTTIDNVLGGRKWQLR